MEFTTYTFKHTEPDQRGRRFTDIFTGLSALTFDDAKISHPDKTNKLVVAVTCEDRRYETTVVDYMSNRGYSLIEPL